MSEMEFASSKKGIRSRPEAANGYPFVLAIPLEQTADGQGQTVNSAPCHFSLRQPNFSTLRSFS